MSKKCIIGSKVLFWCKWGSASRFGSRDRWKDLQFASSFNYYWLVKTTISVNIADRFGFHFCGVIQSNLEFCRFGCLWQIYHKSVPSMHNMSKIKCPSAAIVRCLVNTLRGGDKRRKQRYSTKRKVLAKGGFSVIQNWEFLFWEGVMKCTASFPWLLLLRLPDRHHCISVSVTKASSTMWEINFPQYLDTMSPCGKQRWSLNKYNRMSVNHGCWVLHALQHFNPFSHLVEVL